MLVVRGWVSESQVGTLWCVRGWEERGDKGLYIGGGLEEGWGRDWGLLGCGIYWD